MGEDIACERESEIRIGVNVLGRSEEDCVGPLNYELMECSLVVWSVIGTPLAQAGLMRQQVAEG
jgi:hypothetical protein